jgi:hypothetical protein
VVVRYRRFLGAAIDCLRDLPGHFWWEGIGMSVRLTASSGAEIRVCHEGDDVFHVERVDLGGEVQICLGVDLFEIVAELAELDLDDGTQAAEAVGLAERARRQLAVQGAVASSTGRQAARSSREMN